MSEGEEATRESLRARLRELVSAARPGDRLPSERDLSRRWRAARMTVRGATDALVAEGLVARRHGSGTYVSEAGSPLARRERLKILTQRADALLAEARHLDVDLDDVIKLFRERQEILARSHK